jgi:serine/threonine-protein kinase
MNMRINPKVVLALALSSVSAGVVAYAEASSEDIEQAASTTAALSGTLILRDVSTGLCLDSNTSGHAYTLGCNGGSFQKWAVIRRSATVVNLRNLATGFCLDSNTAGDAYTLGCNGGNFQNWTVIHRRGDRGFPNVVSLKNVSTGRCLDSNTSGRLYTLGCNGGNFQNWHKQ